MTKSDQKLRDELAREYALGDNDLCHYIDFKAGWDAARANPPLGHELVDIFNERDQLREALLAYEHTPIEMGGKTPNAKVVKLIEERDQLREELKLATTALQTYPQAVNETLVKQNEELRAELAKEKEISSMFKVEATRHANTAVESFELVTTLRQERDQLKAMAERLAGALELCQHVSLPEFVAIPRANALAEWAKFKEGK